MSYPHLNRHEHNTMKQKCNLPDKSLGPQPVGFQCPFTSSLVEFPGYRDWLWYPGLPPMLVSIAFSLRLPYLGVFPLTLLHSPLDFIRVFLYDWRICTHSVNPSLTHFLGEFPGLGLALVPNVVVPEAEQGCTWSRNLIFEFCPGRGLNLRPCSLVAANVTTRLQHTQPPFSRLLRHAGGYSGTILTPSPQGKNSNKDA